MVKDLSYFLSEEAKSRTESPLKGAFKYRSIPGMRSLGGGLPLPELFPFDDLRALSPSPPYKDGVFLPSFDGKQTTELNITRAIGEGSQEDIELRTALQYGQSNGEERLRNFIKEHMQRIHTIPYEGWDIILTCGNSFSWDSMLRTFTNRGDAILVEEFAFSSALETAHANGVTPVGVEMDLEGILPEALEKQLQNWVGAKPKLLYTVPTGQNPTGSSLSAERRKAVYEIAKKHDFLIVEDEPYYYLQFPPYSHENHADGSASSTAEMVKSLVPSFLDFDTEGRVLRLDSFSKVIAPGTRIGWVVAQEAFIERLLRLYETTMQSPSGFSQAIVYGTLRRWGQEGYLEWLNKLKAVYTSLRDVACDAIYENFPKGLYEFCPPVAGMFYWFKVDARRFKDFDALDRDAAKCEMALFQKALDEKVLIIPGRWFMSPYKTDPPQPELEISEADKHAMYFRGTFAGVSLDELKSALRDFGRVLHRELVPETQA